MAGVSLGRTSGKEDNEWPFCYLGKVRKLPWLLFTEPNLGVTYVGSSKSHCFRLLFQPFP